MSATSHRVGPERDRLVLRTSRQGFVAQVGHDLTIEVTRWSGEVVVADDPARSSVTVSAKLGTLRVVDGTGGITPLSDRDRREIARTARELLDADRQPEARFTSVGVTASGLISGNLTIRGETRPLELTVTDLGGGRYRATGTVLQSRYGIRPYTAFLGALRVADAVAVEAEVDLSGGGPG
jgi:polyisoprenoid-binding protein YceI